MTHYWLSPQHKNKLKDWDAVKYSCFKKDSAAPIIYGRLTKIYLPANTPQFKFDCHKPFDFTQFL